MRFFLALLLPWLGPAIAVLSNGRTLRGEGALNHHHHHGIKHRQLQGDFDPDRLALFFDMVNGELESKKIRGASYAFRGPVR
jgi:hypothetical protein